jgi:hypothetical protein
MHERKVRACLDLRCDVCGAVIRAGEWYYQVRDEYTRGHYNEHITCPGAAAVICPPPVKPVPRIFNRAMALA